MEMIGKVICLIAMVSVLSLPAIAGSQSESEISDFGIKYMDCQYESGFVRGPISDDPTNIDSGIETPSPLEYNNDEGSCGLSLPDSTETEIQSPPPETPIVPIPPEEKPGDQINDDVEEDEEEEKQDEEEEEEDPTREKPDDGSLVDANDDDDDDSSLVDANDDDDSVLKDIEGPDLSGPRVGIPINNDGGSITSEPGEPITPPGTPPNVAVVEGEMTQGAGTAGATVPASI